MTALIHVPTDDCGSIYERQDSLRLISREAEYARAGSGRVVLLRGGTGTGRTTLLEAVTCRGEQDGMLVLRARCSAEESSVDFAAILQLLDTGDGHGPGSAMPDTTDRPAGPGCPSKDRERSLHGAGLSSRLWGLLRARAAYGPLLLALDDVHLADPASRTWLAQIARLLYRIPVLLVMTERRQYDLGPPAAGIAHALPPSLVQAQALGPLSPAASADLVRRRLGEDVPPAWVDGCVSAGAGNPLLLRALLDDLEPLIADCRAPSDFPVTTADLYSGHYVAAVAWWLDNAGPTTTSVARAFAEFEDMPDTVGLLPGIVHADPSRVSGWVTAMLLQGLLVRDARSGRPRFAHALLRETVRGGWSQQRRATAHLMAAESLHRRGDPMETVARHLLLSPPVGAEWAVDALVKTAESAVRADAVSHAMACLRRALDEPLSRERRGTLLTELGGLESATRHFDGVRHLTEALRLQTTGAGRVEVTVALGYALARRGEVRAGLDALHDLDKHLTAHPGLRQVAQHAGALIASQDGESWLRVVAGLRHRAGRPSCPLTPTERVLLAVYRAGAGLLSADAAMEEVRALSSGPLDPLVEPYVLGTAAVLAQWADQWEETGLLLARGLGAHRPRQLHPAHRALVGIRADAAVAQGRYQDLLSNPADWEVPEDEAVETSGEGPSNAQAQAILALLATGRTTRAGLLAGRFTDPGTSWDWDRFLYARGTVRAAGDDPAGALEDFLECGRQQTARGVMSPAVIPWRSAAAECRIRLGQSETAIRLAEEELRLATVWGTPRTVGRALRVLGTATGGRRGLELGEHAVAVLRDSPVETELIPALVAQGRQLIYAGQRKHARTMLREAAHRAEQLGAAGLLRTVEEALREGGARRVTGAGTLTGSERRVAALAADGRTNTEICELLHLARRTVETHLTSAYRKLGITSRTALPAALSGPSLHLPD